MTIQLPPRVPRKIVETDLVRGIVVAVNRIPGVRATRNNVGTLEDKRGIPVTYGLGTGSPDVVGIITIGGVESAIPSLRERKPVAFAFGIEVKQPKRYATREQRGWHAVATRRGMPTIVARSSSDALAFLYPLIVELGELVRRAA